MSPNRHRRMPTTCSRFVAQGMYASCFLAQRAFFACKPADINEILVTNSVDFDSLQDIKDGPFTPIILRAFAFDKTVWAKYQDSVLHAPHTGPGSPEGILCGMEELHCKWREKRNRKQTSFS